MKSKRLLVIAASLAAMGAAVAFAADHKIPVAPKEFEEMKNPLEGDKAAIERGEKLYVGKCKKCHGVNGDAKTSAAEGMDIHPPSFTAPGYLKGRSDGQLAFITTKGSPDTEMEGFGPGSDTNFPQNDVWSIIAYLRSAFTK